MTENTDVWSVIRDARDARGWTNQHLSEESGVPESSVQKIITGKTLNPSFDSVAAMCRALNLSLDSICGIDSNAAVDEIAQLRRELEIAKVRTETAEAKRETAETRLQSQINEYNQMITAYEYRIDISKDRTIWLRRYLMFTLSLILILVIAVVGVLIYDITHQDRGWFQTAAAYYYAGVQKIIDFWA